MGVERRNFTGALPECIRIDIILQNLHSSSMVFVVKEFSNSGGVVWDFFILVERNFALKNNENQDGKVFKSLRAVS